MTREELIMEIQKELLQLVQDEQKDVAEYIAHMKGKRAQRHK